MAMYIFIPMQIISHLRFHCTRYETAWNGYLSFKSIKFCLFLDQFVAHFIDLPLLRWCRLCLRHHPQFLLIGSQINITQTLHLDLLPQVSTTMVNVGRWWFWYYSSTAQHNHPWDCRIRFLQLQRMQRLITFCPLQIFTPGCHFLLGSMLLVDSS